MPSFGFTTYRIIICVAILLGLSTEIIAQQAWVKEKGTGYLQAGFSSLSYSSLHQGNENALILPREIRHTILSIYGEYGIANRLMVDWNIPFHLTRSGEFNHDFRGGSPIQSSSLSALGNPDLGLTYQLWKQGGTSLSLRAGFAPNLASVEETSGLRTGYDASTLTFSALAGHGSRRHFASAELGGRALTSDYLNRFFFKGQIGAYLDPLQKWTTILGLDALQTLGTSNIANDLDGAAIYTGLYLNDQSYLAATFKIGYRPSDSSYLWLAAAGGFAQNVGRGIAYSAAIAMDLN